MADNKTIIISVLSFAGGLISASLISYVNWTIHQTESEKGIILEKKETEKEIAETFSNFTANYMKLKYLVNGGSDEKSVTEELYKLNKNGFLLLGQTKNNKDNFLNILDILSEAGFIVDNYIPLQKMINEHDTTGVKVFTEDGKQVSFPNFKSNFHKLDTTMAVLTIAFIF